MSENQQSDDEVKIAEDEEVVHESFMKNEITSDKVNEIEGIKELEDEAEKIKLEDSVGQIPAPTTAEIIQDQSDSSSQLETVKQEEKPVTKSPSPVELSEVQKEPRQEVSGEPVIEVIKEIKQGI